MFHRGTTPTLTFVFDTNLDELNITSLYLSFKQNCSILFEKTIDDIEINGNIFTVTLTQEETLKMLVDTSVFIQAKIKIDDKVFATNIIRTDINEILKEEVI